MPSGGRANPTVFVEASIVTRLITEQGFAGRPDFCGGAFTFLQGGLLQLLRRVPSVNPT